MKHLPIFILLSLFITVTSCNKDEDFDPLAEYYGTYMASETLSDDTWNVTFSAGDNPGEIFIENALSDVDEIDMMATIEGSNFTFEEQPILESSLASGTGTIADNKVDCRITLTIGLIKIYYTVTYEKL